MAKGKKKRQRKLYDRLRARGLRKRAARELSQLPRQVSKGRAPKAVRKAVSRLEATSSELRSHTRKGDRKAARARARKA